MSHESAQTNYFLRLIDNTKVLGLAGAGLFFLGLGAAILGLQMEDLERKVTMALSAAVLLSMGYPALMYVKAAQKIELLEKRIDELESKTPPNP